MQFTHLFRQTCLIMRCLLYCINHCSIFKFCSRKCKNDIKYCILAWLSVVWVTCDGGIRKSNLVDYVLICQDLALLPDCGINSRLYRIRGTKDPYSWCQRFCLLG
jgi:hypothetical protein